MSGPPAEVNDTIAGYLSRKDAQSFVNTDVFRTDNLSCSVGCPPNHRCFPAGHDCLIGERRPNRDNCCQFDTTNAHLMYMQIVAAMQRVALFNLTTANRGPASEGYIHDLGRLIPANTLHHTWPFFREIQSRNSRFVILNFIFANDQAFGQIPNPYLVKLISLGSKLFRGISVHLRDNLQAIRTIDRSVRDNPRVFIDTMHTPVPLDVPVDILSASRNIKIRRGEFTHVGPTLTEQRLFDILRQKLLVATTTASKAIIDMLYTNAGQDQMTFDTIVQACNGTSFTGYMMCRLMDETNVTQGTFHGVTISVIASSAIPSSANEPNAFRGFTGGSPRVLVISR